MSNQFYKFILEELIIDYFKKNINEEKQRFYFKIYEEINNGNLVENSIEKFIEVAEELKNSNLIKYGTFKLGTGIEEYKSYYIESGENKILLAFETTKIISNYFVTIRNKIGEENIDNDLEKCSVVFIITSDLDSITGGSKNLSQENMPLCIENIMLKLKNKLKIKKSYEKSLFEFLIDNNSKNRNSSIFDYKEILTRINKIELENTDFYKLGVFKDEILKNANTSAAEIKDRAKNNFESFEKINSIIEKTGSDYPKHLENILDEKGINELKKVNGDLSRIEYEIIKESEISLEKSKKISIESIERESYKIWQDSRTRTIVGSRKKDIVIFNPNKEDIKLKVCFSKKRLKKSDIKANTHYLIKEENLGYNYILLSIDKNEMFQAIAVTIEKTQFNFNICIINLQKEFFYETIKFEVDVENKKLLFFNKENLKFGECLIKIPENCMNATAEKNTIVINETINFDFEIISNEERIAVGMRYKEENRGGFISNAHELLGEKLKANLGLEFRENKIENLDTRKSKTIDSTLSEYLKLEEYIVNNRILYGSKLGNVIESEEICIESDLKEKYLEILDFFKENGIPSIIRLKRVENKILDYLNLFFCKIDSIEAGDSLAPKTLDIFKIGVIKDGNKILLSPCHPLQLAYYLELENFLGNNNYDKIKKYANRFTPNYAIPFYVDKEKKIEFQNRGHFEKTNWLLYEEGNNDIYSSFLDRVISDKLASFYKHFKNMFEINQEKPLILNFYENDELSKIFEGIYNFQYKQTIPKKIIINIYSKQKSHLHYKKLNDLEKINSKDYNYIRNNYNVKVDFDDNEERIKFEEIMDSMEWYFKTKIDSNEYCHIAFTENQKYGAISYEDMKKMKDISSLNGLITGLATTQIQDKYKIGFGNKNNQSKKMLSRVYYLYNELLGNTRDEPYVKGLVIAYTITKIEDEKNFLNANWIVLINPIRGLEIIENDTYLLHYSDQYTNSNSYDSITVTKKIKKYKEIIENELKEKFGESAKEINTNKILNYFNFLNGEWLLKLVKNESIEKLSYISATKFILKNLEVAFKEKILWIPISMEEILRIASNTGLKLSESIHNKRESASDDLLFLGLENKENGELVIYPIVVEVKYGKNPNKVKAIDQVKSTYFNYLFEDITSSNDAHANIVKNFYATQFLVSLNKGKLFKINEEWSLDESVVTKLKNLEFKFSFDLSIAGIVMLFKDNVMERSLEEEIIYNDNNEENKKKVIVFNYSQQDIITTLSSDYRKLEIGNTIYPKIELENLLNNNSLLLTNKEDTCFYKEIVDKKKNEKKAAICDYSQPDVITTIPSDYKKLENEDIKYSEIESENLINVEKLLVENRSYTKEEVSNKNNTKKNDEKNKKESNILLGVDILNKKNVYWEFQNRQLSNRHLLITGKSGSGKTYGIQTMLYECFKNEIPSIIFDYTAGFAPSHLDEVFKEKVGIKLNQRIVKHEKLPINPFQKNIQDIGGIILSEDNSDVANRVSNTLSKVYSFGDQQKSIIYEAIKECLEIYETKTTFENLRLVLQEKIEENKSIVQSVLSKLSSFFDANIFGAESLFSWKDIIQKKEIFIVQLIGYDRDTQKIIVELILWDIWNYFTAYGREDNPVVLVLDECQNISHAENSASGKILTEGRKFGLSGWYATQFLKGNFKDQEIQALQQAAQKIYFQPNEKDVIDVSKFIDVTGLDRNYYAEELHSLKKGECIVIGSELETDVLKNYKAKKIKILSFQEREKN